MTAPDLLQVIAVALHWHSIGIDPETGPVCICGENLSHLDNTEEHQAAVILKAISEAGTVEWGVQTASGPALAENEREARISASIRKWDLLSRVTGPWMTVEG